MLAKIKTFLTDALYAVVGLLAAYTTYLRGKTQQANDALSAEKASEESANAVAQEKQDAQVAKSADDSFEHLASEYESHNSDGTGK